MIAVGVVPCAAQAPSASPAYALVGGVKVSSVGVSASPFTLVSEAARLSPAQRRAFRTAQLSEERVRAASERVGSSIAAHFERAGVPYPTDVLFRVFKSERVFQVWGLDPSTGRYVLVRDYPVCAVSGHLGPKTRRGDLQMPEGFYSIDLFNPRSRFHLSMRVNYPNAADLARGQFDDRMGGDIYVHGGCATVGCVPVTDDVIEELYVLAVDARSNGQASIPIHIFPSRMEGSPMRDLWEEAGGDWSMWRFWLSLKAGYDHFQTHRQEPVITIDGDGFYRFEG
ncbi:MAG TPA: L,D-transpeptidase family protein [Longimicrobiales bacterium]|nr:L,D-transpeptidase family protein [Longimicrobiales bacterium]